MQHQKFFVHILTICLLPIVFLAMRCREEKRKIQLGNETLYETYIDSTKEKLLFRIGENLIRGIIYDIKEDASHQQNQAILEELLNKSTLPYDSIIIHTFVLVRTNKDTLQTSYKLPVSADGFKLKDSNIKELFENNIHLVFMDYRVNYYHIKPIEKNGKTYNTQIGLFILTEKGKTDRQIWIDIALLNS